MVSLTYRHRRNRLANSEFQRQIGKEMKVKKTERWKKKKKKKKKQLMKKKEPETK